MNAAGAPVAVASRVRASTFALVTALGLAACGESFDAPSSAGDGGDGTDTRGDSRAALDAGPAEDANRPHDAGADARSPEAMSPDVAPPPCTTRITYGLAWIHPPNHPAQDDIMQGGVSWDGTCTDDGPNSFAVLSNGWKPYFTGNGACVIALDSTGPCPGVASSCTSRIGYGAAWLPPPNHPAFYDDVAGRVFSDRACHDSGGQSYAVLSNGWTPTFSGNGACRLSFEYRQCGGLYANPVVPTDCPDPGVLRDGSQYVLTCTSGDAPDAYPIYTSPDLASWTLVGHIFPSGHWPLWAQADFWAPEIHVVGGHYVAYFSARGADGRLAVGAASAPSATGPFTDIGQPLVHDPSMGLIDASEFTAPNGTPYALWKEDGNAVGLPTPIHGQPLAPDGLSLVGSPSTLITNDEAWEGAVTEAPFMVQNGGTYYLFYSGGAYYNASYAVGVARATSPLGPFTKLGGPILTTAGAWVGPGHCSVVDTTGGDTYIVYHAWQASCVNGPGCGRLVLTDAVAWQNGWAAVPLAPSESSRPLP